MSYWESYSPSLRRILTSIKILKSSWFCLQGHWQILEGNVILEITILTQYHEYSEFYFRKTKSITYTRIIFC